MSAEAPPPTSSQAQDAHDPSAHERLVWMTRNSRILIAALVLIVVAVLLVAFSSAIFTSSSANPGNLATSGVMSQSNSNADAAILTAENLLPGESGDGSVTITNIGDASGNFTLEAENLVDDPADPAFSAVLTLVVADEDTEVYNGSLADVEADPIDLGTWAVDEEHTFTFTVTFDETAGNEYQGAKTTHDFVWNATQS